MLRPAIDALSYVFVRGHTSASDKDVMEVESFYILYERAIRDLLVIYIGRKKSQDFNSGR